MKIGCKHKIGVDFDIDFIKRNYLANFTIYILKRPCDSSI